MSGRKKPAIHHSRLLRHLMPYHNVFVWIPVIFMRSFSHCLSAHLIYVLQNTAGEYTFIDNRCGVFWTVKYYKNHKPQSCPHYQTNGFIKDTSRNYCWINTTETHHFATPDGSTAGAACVLSPTTT